MMARRSALSSRGQRAISGSVRPQPKHRPVFGSIRQTATQGDSVDIEILLHIALLVQGALFQTGAGAHDGRVAGSRGFIGIVVQVGLQRRRLGDRRQRRHHALRWEGHDHFGADPKL